MRVLVNGKPISLASRNISLLNLISEKSIAIEGCAIAINGHILPRNIWGETILTDGDQISLFQAIAGG
ncbi:thiamine biosynthesis protein ThiS [Vibrio sp. HA2012]|uniref:sulfur carrier protein ThiS n=1 Tax=Vibrio sp. HA2012 TaxID=1971595 RepID=UPI000C2CAF16|nr:sulfur carrier protein ThiS [Vibrio sp. HA2012]PJC84944.1 thiamine biosynthesis protein ThiS [Vibrio sp. HA2012]